MSTVDPSYQALAQRLQYRRSDKQRGAQLSRRDVLWLLSASTASAALASLSGCATSPVTGEKILVGMSEGQERQVDQQIAPHQFSQDLGAIQDSATNQYVSEVGARLHTQTHRPGMPYNYRVLNANYVNAYTFPAGAVGVTRGIIVELQDEAQLAALLGHELGHVNARHAAQRQGQAMLGSAIVAGVNIAASNSQWSNVVGIGSQLGASALLSSYSRDHEREADALGQRYMVAAGYPASGMTALQQMLVDQEKEQPSMLATMFASHPMSRERRDTAANAAQASYAASLKNNPQRERYMDKTAGLRKIKPTIEACQQGETTMARKQYGESERRFEAALKRTPEDYAANLRMAECLYAQNRHRDAQRYADQARKIYPQEAQSHKLIAVNKLSLGDPGAAYVALDRFDQLLPGDPGITFLKGVSLESMGNRQLAAKHFYAYAQAVPQGGASQYSVQRLRQWGYLK